MAIPNVNAITSTLRTMSDQQLQQYAMLHKNDPYILPMAVSESNSRKQMRSEQQGLAAGQHPQPKVAEADIAGMAQQPQMAPQGQLPEQQGIGALPAPNMQHMADGGIAGYTDGGMDGGMDGGNQDANLVYNNEPAMRMAGGGAIRFADRGFVNGGVSGDIPGYVPNPNNFIPQVGGTEDMPFMQRKAREAAEAIRAGTATPQQKAMVGWANRLGLGTPEMAPAPEARPTQSPESSWPTAKAAPEANTKPPVADQKPPTDRRALANTPAAPATSYMDQAETIFNKNRPAEAQGLETLMAEKKAAREAAGVTGEAGEAQKQALEKEASTAADDKKEMLWMAMIKGGLAAAGGTSQYAIKNIADGFGVGVDDAAKGLKELRQAEKERNKGLAAIEESRRAEKRGDVDAAIAARDKQKDHLENFNMHAMQAQTTLMGHQIGANATVEGAKIHAAATKAAAGAGQREQQAFMERLGAAEPGSNLRKGFELSKQESSMPRMYTAYTTAASDPMKGEAFQAKYPTFETFMAGMGGGGGAGQIYSDKNLPTGALRGR